RSVVVHDERTLIDDGGIHIEHIGGVAGTGEVAHAGGVVGDRGGSGSSLAKHEVAGDGGIAGGAEGGLQDGNRSLAGEARVTEVGDVGIAGDVAAARDAEI